MSQLEEITPVRTRVPPPPPPPPAPVSSLEPKHRGARLALRAGVVVAIVASIVVAVLKEAGQIGELRWRFEPGWLAICLVALLAFELAHIELWRMTLRSLGGRIDAPRGRAIWSTTLLARYVPTSALMAVGRVALAEREGVPKRVTLASVAYEVAFTVMSSVVLCVYLLWRLPSLDAHAWIRWVALAIPIVGLVLLHRSIFHRFTDYALKRIGRPPLPVSLGYGRVLQLAALYVVSFVIAGVAVLAMAHAIHPLPAGGTYAALASYGLGYVAGVVAFVIPGSLGAREAGIALGLSAVLPTGVAVAVAIALRLLQIGVELLYATVTPIVARRASR